MDGAIMPIGYRFVGKTLVSNSIAEKLGCKAYDLD
jgi:shikimate kinase